MPTNKSAHSRETREVTVALRVALPLFTNHGETISLDLATMAESDPMFFNDWIGKCAMNVLNDIKGEAKATPEEKFAAKGKRVNAWETVPPTWTIKERADSSYVAMEKVYITEMMAALSMQDAEGKEAIKASMGDTVKAALGSEAKNTFANFLKARSMDMAAKEGETRSVEELTEALVAKYEAMVQAAAESAAKEVKKIVLPDFDI